jgi:hypothetical protein
MTARLHRYWFVGDAANPFGVAGVGVTAFTEDDARFILKGALPRFAGMTPWRQWSEESLNRAQVVEDVDVRLLDQGHVIPNMGLVVYRGIWWPKV